MNIFRCVSVIISALFLTVASLTDLGIVVVFAAFLCGPFFLTAFFSLFWSAISWFTKEKEHLCIKVANRIMVACLVVCMAYSVGWQLYKKWNYHIVASYFERDGPHSGYTYIVFTKDGRVLSGTTVSLDKVFSPLYKGTYIQKGDTIYHDNRKFVVDSKNATLTDIEKSMTYVIE